MKLPGLTRPGFVSCWRKIKQTALRTAYAVYGRQQIVRVKRLI